MEALKKRLSEVEGQLKDQTAAVGMVTQERDRLLVIEGKLNDTIRRQADELNTLKREHEVELLRLVEVRTTTEAGLQKERNEAVQKLEVATSTHQRALRASQGQASEALATLHEMDEHIAGESPLISSNCLFATSPLNFFRVDFSLYACARLLARDRGGRRQSRGRQPTSPTGEW